MHLSVSSWLQWAGDRSHLIWDSWVFISTDCHRENKQTPFPGTFSAFPLLVLPLLPTVNIKLNWSKDICYGCNIYPWNNGLPRSMFICLLVPVDCFSASPAFSERINRCHTAQMVWSPVTSLHISLFYWMWLTPPDVYIFLQPCTVVANKKKKKWGRKGSSEGERGGRKSRWVGSEASNGVEYRGGMYGCFGQGHPLDPSSPA